MKLSGNQRRLYLLSAVLLALTLAISATWGLWGGSPGQTDAVAPAPNASGTKIAYPTPTPSLQEASDAVLPDGDTVSTVVYYQDNYGYLVPVTRDIPKAEGIAKATLSTMVAGVYNDMEAARLGLRTVLPEGTDMDLDVSQDGTCRIDLSQEALNSVDAEAEANMVSAVVQTLTEFPSIQKVNFLIGGQKRDRLTFGTDVSQPFERGAINLESTEEALAPESAQTVQLYFPGDASSLIVPVTRMVYGSADLNTAVLELLKGPSTQSPLDNALPGGCGLIGVDLKDGVATINFTKEFMNIAGDSDGGRMAMRALMLTCLNFDGVKEVKLQVEGEPYDPGQQTLATPTFVNDASTLNEEYLRTQTASILEEE